MNYLTSTEGCRSILEHLAGVANDSTSLTQSDSSLITRDFWESRSAQFFTGASHSRGELLPQSFPGVSRRHGGPLHRPLCWSKHCTKDVIPDPSKSLNLYPPSFFASGILEIDSSPVDRELKPLCTFEGVVRWETKLRLFVIYQS